MSHTPTKTRAVNYGTEHQRRLRRALSDVTRRQEEPSDVCVHKTLELGRTGTPTPDDG